MAGRKIIWSPEAREEFIVILEFYYKRNGNSNYSRKLNNEIKRVISHLSANPKLGLRTNIEDIRVLIVGVFLIFYSLAPKQIEVLAIIDSRQDPEKVRFRKE